MAMPHGTHWPCYLYPGGTAMPPLHMWHGRAMWHSLPVLNLCLFSDFFRVARPTVVVRHRLLYVALSAGLAFLKNRF